MRELMKFERARKILEEIGEQWLTPANITTEYKKEYKNGDIARVDRLCNGESRIYTTTLNGEIDDILLFNRKGVQYG